MRETKANNYARLLGATSETFELAVEWLNEPDKGQKSYNASRKHSVRAAWKLLTDGTPQEIAREIYNRCENQHHNEILEVIPEPQSRDVQRALSELDTTPPNDDTTGSFEASLCIADLGPPLQSGGFGSVYRLPNDPTRVAKVLNAGGDMKRFQRELKILQHLKGHDGIVQVYGKTEPHDEDPQPYDSNDNVSRSYIVMDYFPGDVLARGHSAVSIARVVAKVANTLTHAHKHEVIHRDISPNNILHDRQSHTVKLIDWGISAVKNDNPDTDFAARTKKFAAPDEIRNLAGGDIYSCGRILTEILAEDDNSKLAKRIREIAERCFANAPNHSSSVEAISSAAELERALTEAVAEESAWSRFVISAWSNVLIWRVISAISLTIIALWFPSPNLTGDSLADLDPLEVAAWDAKPRRVLLERWEAEAHLLLQRAKYESARERFRDIVTGCGSPKTLPDETARLRARALLEIAIVNHKKLNQQKLAERDYEVALAAWKALLPETVRDSVSVGFENQHDTQWLKRVGTTPNDIQTMAGLARCYGYMGDLHFSKEDVPKLRNCYRASRALREHVAAVFTGKTTSLVSLQAQLELYRGEANEAKADWWGPTPKSQVAMEVDRIMGTPGTPASGRFLLCEQVLQLLQETTDEYEQSQLEELLLKARLDVLASSFKIEAGHWQHRTCENIIPNPLVEKAPETSATMIIAIRTQLDPIIDSLPDRAGKLARVERDLILSRLGEGSLKNVYTSLHTYVGDKSPAQFTEHERLICVRVAAEYAVSNMEDGHDTLRWMHEVLDPVRPREHRNQSPPNNERLPRIYKEVVSRLTDLRMTDGLNRK